MQHLEIETPEHVILDLEIAGVGSRALAALIDSAILFGGTLAAIFLIITLAGLGIAPHPWMIMLVAGGIASGWLLYFALFEGLRHGQTPGKHLIGIRVVSDTGHAVTFGAAAVRNLLRIADFLPPPYLTGMVLAALHPRGKRLGDLAAGTVVVRDRPEVMRVPTAPSATEITPTDAEQTFDGEIPELSDAEFRLLERFETRYRELPPAAGTALAARLVERMTTTPPTDVDTAAYLLDLYAREHARRRGRLGGVERSGVTRRFTERKLSRWDEFQHLAERAAQHGLDSFRADELPDFAARYREVAADLARARTYHADAATQARLERLVAAGHNALYRNERHTAREIWTFLARECPAAVVSARWTVFIAFLTFVVPATAGYVMLRERPALAAEIVPETMLRRAEAGTERKAAGLKYVTVSVDERPFMASVIISNNVRVAIACFAGGIFLGVGSLLLLAYNGLSIGVFAGHFANRGVLDYLLEFIVSHGPLELFAIWVAGAAGFLLGRAVVAPGQLSRAEALVLNGRTALRMVGAVVVLLVVAGLIEGFVSAGGGSLKLRAAVSVGSVLFLVAYLAIGARALRADPATRSAGPATPAKSLASE